MFLDSGNIISDETFCTQSQIMTWASQLSSSNWCHMIQKGHVTPTATNCHPLTDAEIFCRKFRELFHHNLTQCAECFIRKKRTLSNTYRQRQGRSYNYIVETNRAILVRKNVYLSCSYDTHRLLSAPLLAYFCLLSRGR